MKKLRKKKGLTQRQLGMLVDMDQSYISKIEKGYIEGLTVGKLIKLAGILGVSPEKLLFILIQQRKRRRQKEK